MDNLYLVYMRSSNFTARCIQFFMRLYALRFNRIWRKPVNHTDILYNDEVWGTTAKGFLPRTQEEAWHKAKQLIFFKLETDKNDEEILEILNRYKYRPYDFKNFWDFIVKLFTSKWPGKTGKDAEARLYCIEAVHMVMDELGIEPSLENAWDNDPEESLTWALHNLKLTEIR